MLFFPPAKINIGLRILRRRADAYHDLELSFFPVAGLYDVLEITPAEQDSFVCEGLPVSGPPEENLVLKALQALDELYPGKRPPCCIHLLKKIPMGSGLGGGSSDAAHTLMGLNRVFNLGIPDLKIREMAAGLGADCAFFTQGKACMGYGKGDELEQLPQTHNKTCRILIVVPDFSISTAQAYKNSHPREGRVPLKTLLSENISNWRENIHNDFEDTLSPVFPQIEEIKRLLYRQGAFYASLSGSGSAVFGLFEQDQELVENDFPKSYFTHQSRISIP